VLSPKTQLNLKNAKSYFAEHLSIGDYYGANARIQGEWLGEGAAKLGLAGVLAGDDFLVLCENKHPKNRKRPDATVRCSSTRLLRLHFLASKVRFGCGIGSARRANRGRTC